MKPGELTSTFALDIAVVFATFREVVGLGERARLPARTLERMAS